MSKFFINRPIVAMVISIITVIVGLVTLFTLPIAQLPKIIPPEIFVEAHYVGADAKTIEQSVATPIEQQLSGVDNMNYMYSLNANNGLMRLYVNFDVKTDPNVDHMLTQLRYSQAEAQLPADVRNYGGDGSEIAHFTLPLRRALFAEQDLRCKIPRELRLYQSQRRTHPGAGHRQRDGFRRRPIRHAPLGQTRPTRETQYHRSGNHRGGQQAEHRESGGQDRWRARAGRAGIHLFSQRPGPARVRAGVC